MVRRSAICLLIFYTTACTVQSTDQVINTPALELSSPAAPSERPDGARLIYAPNLPKSAQNAAFSPDGQVILFTLFHEGYNKGPAGLYTVSVSGGRPTTLLDEPDQDSVNLPGACWNEPTKRIIFSSDRQDIDEIWSIAPNGSNPTRITYHSALSYFLEPSFSPDGQWIVFEISLNMAGDESQSTIWKARADGSEMTQLSGDADQRTDDRQPNWSPRGDRILFQRRQVGSENWDIFTITPDGNNLQAVTDTPFSDTDASWSPDGAWITYSSDQSGLPFPNIFIIQAKGGRPIRVTYDDSHEDCAPSWSPDGMWIAFESHSIQDEEEAASLWIIPVPILQ